MVDAVVLATATGAAFDEFCRLSLTERYIDVLNVILNSNELIVKIKGVQAITKTYPTPPLFPSTPSN